MSELQTVVQNGLDEARMLVLGAQVLLGFQYRAFFERGFEELPQPARMSALLALGCLLATLALLFSACPRHTIVDRGHDSGQFHHFLLRTTGLALAPFAGAMGLAIGVASSRILPGWGAVASGAAACGAALAFWFAHFARRDRNPHTHREDAVHRTPLDHRIVQVLTEARVVLPGAQALLGFALAITLMDAFPRLPRGAQLIHLASLGCIALATILLVAPAAYHRIVERGHDSERVHAFASRCVLSALALLGPGFAGDLYVVLRKMGFERAAMPGALISVLGCWTLWFGLPAFDRLRRVRAGQRPAHAT